MLKVSMDDPRDEQERLEREILPPCTGPWGINQVMQVEYLKVRYANKETEKDRDARACCK